MKKLGMVLAGCVFGASMMAATATTAMAADGPTIQMIVMSINSEYWLNVKAGAEAELEKVGGELIYFSA